LSALELQLRGKDWLLLVLRHPNAPLGVLNRVGWVEVEVEAWLRDRMDDRSAA
jgi:hypothetical protein